MPCLARPIAVASVLACLSSLQACSSSSSSGGAGGTDASAGDAPHDGTTSDVATDSPSEAALVEIGGADGPADALSADSPYDASTLDSSGGSTADASDGGAFAPGAFSCATCPAGTKQCNDVCYDTATLGPALGCADPSTCTCDPPHAVPTCTAGACAIGSCDPGWGDCDGMVSNGCETNLRATATCGACGTSCASGQVCSATGCITACAPPLTACGSSCVDLTSDPLFCGSCTNACAGGPSWTSTCSGGACKSACLAGFTACATGGCDDLQNDPDSCGTCGHVCPAIAGGVATCQTGVCGVLCAPWRQQCSSGCVVESVDPANCGACGNACPNGDVCTRGTCVAPSSTYLLTGLSTPFALAVDATSLYYIDAAGLHFIPKTGGTPVDIATNAGSPSRVAVDDTYAYWSENLGASIMRAPKDGSGSQVLVAAATQPVGVVVDDTYVYWVTNLNLNIYRALKIGGTASILATVPTGGTATSLGELATDGTYLVVADGGGGIFAYDKMGSLFDTAGGNVLGNLVAARSGRWCASTSGGYVLECNDSGPSFGFGQEMTALTISTCAIAFALLNPGNPPQYASYLSAKSEGWSTTLTFASFPTTLMVSDGVNLYFIDGSGDIGALPVP